jgi:SAM-dependent methyltransferase
MNENHMNLCPSPEWAAFIQQDVLPKLTADLTLGDEMLEIGPGPGAATDWLRHKVKRLVAVESDEELARKLTEKYADVEVVHGDATALRNADNSFDSVASFTMLHHVPTITLQNRLLSEALRVLRPGGVLFGGDSLPSNELHHFHKGDTYNPIDPGSFLPRLQTIGFYPITITWGPGLQFVAYKRTEES